jgi:hypothetical protein
MIKKTVAILGICLLVLVSSAGIAGAARFALLNTEWTGVLTTVTRLADGNVTTSPDNATLTFTGEDGDFLAGAITGKNSNFKDLTFTGIRDGRSLRLTAEGTLMTAEIFPGHPVKKGVRPPQNMVIQGSCVGNGTMFEGTLPLTKK